jgi:hypothetical protein
MIPEAIFAFGILWFAGSIGIIIYAIIQEGKGKLNTTTGRLQVF